MDFLDLAKNRFSVRSFKNDHLPQNVIEEILKAGHVAPTGCNFQPQKILVMNTDESIEKLQECTKCHFNCPTAMLICFSKDECWTRKYDGKQSGIVDASIVTTHLMLRAFELGVGSTWVMHFDPFKIKETFNLPKNVEPCALLVMGYPHKDAAPIEMHFKNRPMDEVVFYDSF
jgi:nitroreductase